MAIGKSTATVTPFEAAFGRQTNNRPSTGNHNDAQRKPAAQFWLNIGVLANPGTENEKFVSLPMGLALDTMEPVSTRSSNADFAAFQAGRNRLLQQILAEANKLQPGEAAYLHTEGLISIQIRRVNEERQEASIRDGDNPYVFEVFISDAA